MSNYKITHFKQQYEQSWLRCRALAFLDSAYYDDIHTSKEAYKNPVISLIAINDQEQVIGFLELEYEQTANSVCSKNEQLPEHLAGMIWHVGIHPDYRKKGIAKALLNEAIQQAKEQNLQRLEAWTRDDQFVNDWYTKNGFRLKDEYVHWYFDSHHDDKALLNKILDIKGNTKPIIRIYGQARAMTNEISQLKRKYHCRRFDLLI